MAHSENCDLNNLYPHAGPNLARICDCGEYDLMTQQPKIKQPKEMEARIEKMKKSLPEGWKLSRRTRNLASGPTTYLILSSSVEDDYREFRKIMDQYFPKAFLTSFGGGGYQYERGGTWRIDNFPECDNEEVDIHH